MPILPIERRSLREPNLLVPGRQPVGPMRLDRSHPWTPDFAIAPGITGGYRDAVTNISADIGSGNSIIVLDGVRVLNCVGTAMTGALTLPAVGSGDWTYIWRGKTLSGTGQAAVCATGTYEPGWLYTYRSPNVAKFCMWRGSWHEGITTNSLNTWHTAAKVRNGNSVYHYQDSIADSSDSITQNTTGTSFKFGGNGFVADSSRTEYFYFWVGKALPNAVRIDIERDPYQLWIPA